MNLLRMLLVGGSRDGQTMNQVMCSKLVVQATTGGTETYLVVPDLAPRGWDLVFRQESMTEAAARAEVAQRWPA